LRIPKVGSAVRATFIPSMIFQNVRQTRIVLCATPRPCFFSSAARHLDICSNVIVSGCERRPKSARRLHGHEFVRRFLQHVLPKGFHKVRYFGPWHHSKRHRAAQARLLLDLERNPPRSSNPRRRAFPKSLTKAPQPPSNRGAVHVALEAVSSTSAGSPPKMPSDHDPLLPLPGSILILARVLQTPQPPSDRRPDHLPSRVQ
jgi:hypothetical protein